LILDDALSELDKSRRKKLLERVSGMQTIITCTDFTDELPIDAKVKYFDIENGNIKGEKYV
jgi:DNA replication and repair protein RecF